MTPSSNTPPIGKSVEINPAPSANHEDQPPQPQQAAMRQSGTVETPQSAIARDWSSDLDKRRGINAGAPAKKILTEKITTAKSLLDYVLAARPDSVSDKLPQLIKDLSRKEQQALLRAAASHGESDIVLCLLDLASRTRHFDLNETDEHGMTALHLACKADHVSIAGELLRAGAKPAIGNQQRLTPLMSACKNANPRMAGMLLAHLKNETEIRQKDALDRSALYYAATTGDIETIEQIASAVKHWKTDGDEAMLVAARNGHAEVISKLAAAGIPVNTTNKAIDPLKLAALGNHKDAVLTLVALGAASAASDPTQRNALEELIKVYQSVPYQSEPTPKQKATLDMIMLILKAGAPKKVVIDSFYLAKLKAIIEINKRQDPRLSIPENHFVDRSGKPLRV